MSGIERIIHNHQDTIQSELESSWIIKSIDTSVIHTQSSRWHHSDKKTFHASSLGNTCDRYLYLQYNNQLPEQVISPQLQRIFDHGIITQDRFKVYFERGGLLIGTEVTAALLDPPIRGRADYILLSPLDKQKWIIELKTINSYGFSNLHGARDDHALQLQVYLNLLQVENGIVLYENKNNQELKAFVIRRSNTTWNEILDRCRSIMKMTETPVVNTTKHRTDCQCLKIKVIIP